MALSCAPPVNHHSTDRRAAGESTARPAARRLENLAGSEAAARQLQRLVRQRAGPAMLVEPRRGGAEPQNTLPALA
jgi:hypothetical protein